MEESESGSDLPEDLDAHARLRRIRRELENKAGVWRHRDDDNDDHHAEKSIVEYAELFRWGGGLNAEDKEFLDAQAEIRRRLWQEAEAAWGKGLRELRKRLRVNLDITREVAGRPVGGAADTAGSRPQTPLSQLSAPDPEWDVVQFEENLREQARRVESSQANRFLNPRPDLHGCHPDPELWFDRFQVFEHLLPEICTPRNLQRYPRLGGIKTEFWAQWGPAPGRRWDEDSDRERGLEEIGGGEPRQGGLQSWDDDPMRSYHEQFVKLCEDKKREAEPSAHFHSEDMGVFDDESVHSQNSEPREGPPAFFSPYHTVKGITEIGRYLASASYTISLTGTPADGLEYGLIIVPVGQEDLVLRDRLLTVAPEVADDAAFRAEVLAKSKKTKKRQLNEAMMNPIFQGRDAEDGAFYDRLFEENFMDRMQPHERLPNFDFPYGILPRPPVFRRKGNPPVIRPFYHLPKDENQPLECLMHICRRPEYGIFSPEELELAQRREFWKSVGRAQRQRPRHRGPIITTGEDGVWRSHGDLYEHSEFKAFTEDPSLVAKLSKGPWVRIPSRPKTAMNATPHPARVSPRPPLGVAQSPSPASHGNGDWAQKRGVPSSGPIGSADNSNNNNNNPNQIPAPAVLAGEQRRPLTNAQPKLRALSSGRQPHPITPHEIGTHAAVPPPPPPPNPSTPPDAPTPDTMFRRWLDEAPIPAMPAGPPAQLALDVWLREQLTGFSEATMQIWQETYAAPFPDVDMRAAIQRAFFWQMRDMSAKAPPCNGENGTNVGPVSDLVQSPQQHNGQADPS